jgi:hypothetical protein
VSSGQEAVKNRRCDRDRAGGFVWNAATCRRFSLANQSGDESPHSKTRIDRGMMSSMKLPVLIAVGLLLICTSCKLEPLSATPNSNGNANANQNTSSSRVEQEPASNCSLRLPASPAVNGLRLGMTPDEVVALFPGSGEDANIRSSISSPDRFGGIEFTITPSKYESKDKFTGINQFVLRFLDGRVANIHVGYGGPAYSHVDKFVSKFAEGTSLPPADQWEAYVGMDTQLKTLRCTDFQVQVFAGGPGGSLNYVELTDLEADKKVKDRRAKARAKASPTPGK